MPHADATPEGDGPTKGPEATQPVSLSDLYDDLAARVYGIAAQVVGDDALAEDISERVLLDLYRDAVAGELDGDLHHQATLLTHRAAVCSLRFGTPATPPPAPADPSATAPPKPIARHATVATEPPAADYPTATAASSVARHASARPQAAAEETDLSQGDLSIGMVALLDRLPEAGRLSDVQRQRVALAFYGGRTYDEIARLTDVDPLEVSNDLRAGLRHLHP